jgi:hypothetical protein
MFFGEMRVIRKDAAALIPGPVPIRRGLLFGGFEGGRLLRLFGRIWSYRAIHVPREPAL